MTYKIVQEAEAGLKNFRIKIIELCVITMIADFALMSVSRNVWLLLPAVFLVIAIFVNVLALVVGANRNQAKSDESQVETIRMSYQFTSWEFATLFLYSAAIVAFIVVVSAFEFSADRDEGDECDGPSPRNASLIALPERVEISPHLSRILHT